MRKARLLKLAEVLESPAAEKHFNMGDWFDNPNADVCDADVPAKKFVAQCGAAACTAGWTIAIFEPRALVKPIGFLDNALVRAASLLSLNYDQACDLFTPMSETMRDGTEAMSAGPKQAAKVVRHLAETGKVDWSVA